MVELIADGDTVLGAVIECNGQRQRVRAAKGVILASGGFEKNQALREQYLPAPTNTTWSAGNPGNEGDALLAGLELGAKTRLMNDAWWTTTCVCRTSLRHGSRLWRNRSRAPVLLIAMANDLPTSRRTTWPSRRTCSKRTRKSIPTRLHGMSLMRHSERTSWWDR